MKRNETHAVEATDRALLDALTQSMARGEPVALLTVTGASGALAGALGSRALIWSTGDPLGALPLGALCERALTDARAALAKRRHVQLDYTNETETGTVSIFVEVQAPSPHLLIVGAGHIAVPLAAVAHTCDFRVSVLDDRPQYAHPTRFPTADQVIAGDFRVELARLRARGQLDAHTFVVLVTRGHQYDVASLLEVLDDPLAYIGMIGSQRRVRAVFELLEREQDIAPAALDRIHAPIGLDIGAQTPAEIAVCIVAELINVLRAGPAVGMSEAVRHARIKRRQRAGESTAN